MNNKLIQPIILTILDGWGYSEKIKGNAIKLAYTPTLDNIIKKYPYTLLSASGKDVGLPYQQMGNSEVGHTTIGAGRTINQDLVRIHKSIETKDFFNNPHIHNLCQSINDNKSKLHIIGLCSNGGVHSHIDHLKAILQIVKIYKNNTCLHIITDGRDTKPKEAIKFITDIFSVIENNNNINIASISGRYYSMDRDCRWSRTEKTYKILTENNCTANNANNNQLNQCIAIIEQYYEDGISDEFIPPTKLSKDIINNDDGILFFNFRPDRIRQLLHCFAKKNFKGFKRQYINNLKLLTFTNYDSSLNLNTVFESKYNDNFLGKIISQKGLKQLRLAETEKYAHVTYFFNGGIEEPFPGEDRELIPSPKVETYDLSPNMSAQEITSSVIHAIDQNIYKLIIINYANTDMVGHTGNLNATIESVQFIDKCIKKLLNKVLLINGTLIITADHGNAEYMLDDNNKPCKSHSTNLVPLIMINNQQQSSYNLKPYGCLSDIAPTILDLLKIQKPHEMSGKSLMTKSNINIKIKH
uniref:2,3-bisphosphoglycerate-independent phosphoglycerate mutase n=1 Tax=Pleonosporium borreri TaxID=2575635 RepID=A0A4D6WVD9_9FLOR|nr:Phosphoglycerate mutase [Pleonosporium borreri]